MLTGKGPARASAVGPVVRIGSIRSRSRPRRGRYWLRAPADHPTIGSVHCKRTAGVARIWSRSGADLELTGGRSGRRPSAAHTSTIHTTIREAPTGPTAVLDTWLPKRVQSGHISPEKERFSQMGQTERQRKLVAIAIRGDGTRVHVRLSQPVEVSLLGKLEVIALELIGLITGSRWEPGSRRR